MTDPAKRERAALDVLALLPYRWALGPTSYDPGIGRWSYTARGPHPGRGKMPETITGTGEDELAAMTDLAIRLDERRRDEKLAEIDRRGRAAFLEGAEERSKDGRGPAADGVRAGAGHKAVPGRTAWRGFSHKLQSPADLLAKMEHDYQRMVANPGEPYPALDFFVAAESMADWRYPTDKAKRDAIRAHDPGKTVSHLASGAKHFEATAPRHTSVAGVESEPDYGTATFGRGRVRRGGLG